MRAVGPRLLLVIGGVIVVTSVVLAGHGQPDLAIAPIILVATLMGIWNAPLRIPALVLLSLVLIVDNPIEQPAAGMWKPPLLPLGTAIFENLNKQVNVDALRFSSLDLAIILLLAIVVLRKATNRSIDRAGSVQGATCMAGALVVSLVGLLIMEVWGVLNGGDVRNSLWQIRQPAYVSIIGIMFLAALRGPKDHATIAKIIVVASCWKAVSAIYFYEIICRPLNEKPQYAVTHSDSMLFVTCLVIVITSWYERRTIQSWLLLFGTVPITVLGMIVNNRRLAYVALAVSLLVIFFVVRTNGIKRFIIRAAILSSPLMVVYMAAGWNSNSKVFAPVKTVKSVVSSDADRSTATRDIENYNLIMTLKSNPLLGTGFGREYFEISRADDISTIFAQYRFIPHNSLLGIWAFGGWVGFSAFWTSLVVGTFLAVRSYSLSRHLQDRVAALCGLAVFISYAIQAYGDMGIQSWMCSFILAVALAIVGKLSVAVGAWPTKRKAKTLVTI